MFLVKIKSLGKRLFLFFASLKLAVIIIVALIALSTWGTVVESNYDARTAQEVVFHSPLMSFVLFFLVINLLFSMMKKFPWQKKHLPFLLAHIGILIVILGSYVTQKWGIDGSMAFIIGQKRNFMSTTETFIHIYLAKNDQIFLPHRILSQRVHFLRNPPDNLKLKIQDYTLVIDKFHPYTRPQTQITASQKSFAKPAIHFVIQNAFASISEWLSLEDKLVAYKDFGPLRVILTSQEGALKEVKGNTILLSLPPVSQSLKEEMNYTLFSKGETIQKGVIRAGGVLDTPWMQNQVVSQDGSSTNVKMRLLKLFPKALRETKYNVQKRPTDLTIPAIHVRLQDQSSWIGLNSFDRFSVDDKTYIVSYAENKLSIGFDMQLTQFKVKHYPGSTKAASYESEVLVDGKKHIISMNSPFQKNGFTFYQASFQKDENGDPFMSILSVNRDPGRFLKYLGSFLLVLGIILLFQRRNKKIALAAR